MQNIKIVPKAWGEEKWIVNRDYCGKILILKKGFRCSMHHHKNKDETFYISKGKVLLEYDGKKSIMKPGQAQLIEPNKKHRFTGLEDSEIIEFSTHHEDSDSYREEGMLSGKADLPALNLPEE
ncbi:cupin domain-containing protein [Candidatus Woesearchaeota archaeon]|nr:cupin domain-containing protein [Candidatus Woesearchaeota archaeon]